MNLKSVSHYAAVWNIKERRIRALCEEGRIEGAAKIGRSWLIPEDAEKPVDKRFRIKDSLFFKNIDLNEIDAKKKIIDRHRPLAKNIANQLREKLIVEGTFHSNAIEGNTLTMSETKVVLENGITVKGKPLKDHLEIINHKEAIEFVEDLLNDKRHLTEYEIKSLHHLILKEIDSAGAGKYRLENVLISGAKHIPPSHIFVPDEMQKLIQKYNTDWQNVHPLVRACYLHGEFVKIHPFVDGNGRTARLLLNFELMKNGFPPVIIRNENRADYYDALDQAHVTSDYSAFIEIVAALEKEMENLYLYLLDEHI